ncbi:MAG: AEC family transporter [Hyphomicrobiaceae bacterium]
MLHILLLITPVFSLIAIGFLAAKTRYTSDGAGRIVSEVGYKVAMPALLFRAMLGVGDTPVSPLLLIACYFCGIAFCWLATALLAGLVLRRTREDAASIAMGACFSNGVMLGFPIIIQSFGPDAATPIAFLATCETLFLWLMGTFHMQLVRQDRDKSLVAAVGDVFVEVARNPLVVAMGAGLTCRYLGLTVPELPMQIISIVAQAAVPVSLIGLGMALAGYSIAGQAPTISVILAMKMVIYPAAAFALATFVFKLPPVWAGALVTYVSMPVGANAFLFASRYDRAVASVSAAVAISTAISVFTVTVMLTLLKNAGIAV